MTQTVGELKGNLLNDLTAREHTSFLLVTDEMPRTSTEDLDYVIKTGALPQSAMNETLMFFTKEDMRILDLFSGSGRMLEVACHAGRQAVGVDIDPAQRVEYQQRATQDMFVDECTYFVKDCLHYVKQNLPSETFDFVYADPPRSKSFPWRTKNSGNIGALHIEDYIAYLAELVECTSTALKPNKFMAMHIDLLFNKGQLYDIPGALCAKLQSSKVVRLRLKKSWYFDKRPTACGNLGLVASNINTTYLLAFEATNNNDATRDTTAADADEGEN